MAKSTVECRLLVKSYRPVDNFVDLKKLFDLV